MCVPAILWRDVLFESLNEDDSQLQMSPITIIWSMSAAACLTLAVINFLF
jgi:hypothetical protein